MYNCQFWMEGADRRRDTFLKMCGHRQIETEQMSELGKEKGFYYKMDEELCITLMLQYIY